MTTAPERDTRISRGPLLRRRVVTGLVVAPRGPVGGPGRGAPEPVLRRDQLLARRPGELAARELARHHDACERRNGRVVVAPPLAAAVRRWYLATQAQRHTGSLLAGLDPRSHVLHAVPVDSGLGVDHLVVGPGGVVVLRVAHHAGERVSVQERQVRADGRPLGHVRHVERQVRQVADRLGAAAGHDVAVRAVVVLVGARSVRASDVPRLVTLLTDDELLGWFAQRPRVVSQVDVDRVAALAADPATWGVELAQDETAAREHGEACVDAVRAATTRWRPVRGGSSARARSRT